jgi:hypothetical protein
MWDTMVTAAQSTAVQWSVLSGSVLAYAFKLLSAGSSPLGEDLYSEDAEF